MALFVQGLRLFCSGASPLRPCQAYPRALSWLGFVAYALETVGGWALPILSAQRHLAPDPFGARYTWRPIHFTASA